jgi:hypothetical protein
MTSFEIDPGEFPRFSQSVKAKWAPVLLQPIAGSYERFVIAIAVVGSNGFHVEGANALDKLECFYADDASGVSYAIELAISHLQQDLAKRAGRAISEPLPLIGGVSFGDCRDAEGPSLKAIGASWMQVMSSLYRADTQLAGDQIESERVAAIDDFRERNDRLPVLVMDYVKQRRTGLADYFSDEIQKGKTRNRSNSNVVVDFSGSKVVANFGTLHAGKVGRSVTVIQQRLWHLKVDRDRSDAALFRRRHEMLVYRPELNDPLVTERQQSNLNEAVQELVRQADTEDLRMVAFSSVDEIGNRILTAEAA